jgi:ribonucleoside-triphosphate reductase (formate)
MFHAFLGEKLPDWKAAASLVRKIAENYKLPYYTLSPTYSICKNHGYLAGEQFTCPECGEPAEVYSRITGYYRPVQKDTAAAGNAVYLFTTKTCPNCRMAKSFLDSASVSYRAIDAEENEELVHTYGVMQAPTLIVVNGGAVSQYANASNIKKYVEECR